MHYFLPMNKSLNQVVFVTLLQLQNASVIYPLWFSVLFNIFFLQKFLPIRTWGLNKKYSFQAEATEPPHVGNYR